MIVIFCYVSNVIAYIYLLLKLLQLVLCVFIITGPLIRGTLPGIRSEQDQKQWYTN